MPYPKLVRDCIPALIAASGRQCRTTVLPEPAFRAAKPVAASKAACSLIR